VSVASLLADRERRQAWLDARKSDWEAKSGYFAHWGTESHLGVVLTGSVASGEFNVESDGTITFRVERTLGETIKSRRIRVIDELGVEEQYAAFRAAILDPASCEREN